MTLALIAFRGSHNPGPGDQKNISPTPVHREASRPSAADDAEALRLLVSPEQVRGSLSPTQPDEVLEAVRTGACVPFSEISLDGKRSDHLKARRWMILVEIAKYENRNQQGKIAQSDEPWLRQRKKDTGNTSKISVWREWKVAELRVELDGVEAEIAELGQKKSVQWISEAAKILRHEGYFSKDPKAYGEAFLFRDVKAKIERSGFCPRIFQDAARQNINDDDKFFALELIAFTRPDAKEENRKSIAGDIAQKIAPLILLGKLDLHDFLKINGFEKHIEKNTELKGESALKAAHSFRKKLVQALFFLAEGEYKHRNYESAFNLFTRLYEETKEPSLLYNLGICNARLGMHQSAVRYLSDYLKTSDLKTEDALDAQMHLTNSQNILEKQ